MDTQLSKFLAVTDHGNLEAIGSIVEWKSADSGWDGLLQEHGGRLRQPARALPVGKAVSWQVPASDDSVVRVERPTRGNPVLAEGSEVDGWGSSSYHGGVHSGFVREDETLLERYGHPMSSIPLAAATDAREDGMK